MHIRNHRTIYCFRGFYYALVTKSFRDEDTWVRTSLVTKSPDFIFIYRISGYFGCVKFWLFWAKTGVRKLWLILILALPGFEPKLPYF